MATKLEQLKTRLDKEQAKIAEMTKAIEDEELAELQAEEFASQMVDRQERIAVAVREILDEEPAIVLPAGKSFTIQAGEDGTLSVSTLAKAPAKERKASTKGGNGGRTTITYEGKQMSWSQLADLKGIAYGTGSAHRAVFVADKALHDSIPHENCPYA